MPWKRDQSIVNLLSMKKIIFCFSVFFVICACSSTPTIQNLNKSSASSLSSNSGIVFGKLDGRAVVFKNLATGEERQLNGAKSFSVELPSGEYSLSSFGGRARTIKPLGSSKGLVFTIKPGRATYVGNLFLGSIEAGKSCDQVRSPGMRSKPKRSFPHVGYNNGLLAMGSEEEVSWDQQCLLQYDDLDSDYQANNVEAYGIKLKDVLAL